jgi:hypothetical protein
MDEESTSRRHEGTVEEGDEVELPHEHPNHYSIPVRAGKREPDRHELGDEERSRGEE